MGSVTSKSRDDDHRPHKIRTKLEGIFSWPLKNPFWSSPSVVLSWHTPDCDGFQDVLTVAVTGDWDSSDSGIDWESTEGLTDDSARVVVDYSVDEQLGIPANIQLYWYEWMLYELEDCINDAFSKSPEIFSRHIGVPVRGTLGPIDILQMLKNIAERRDFPVTAISGNYTDFVEATAMAMEFRHLAEHRDRPMEVGNLYAAVHLPRRLQDDVRTRKFEQVLKVLKAGLPSSSDDTEETAEVRTMIFSRHIFADPQLDLLSIIIDDLKKCSFDWAQRLHPEKFSPTVMYKAYEPKFWDREWHYTFRAQDEATKIAFPDPDGQLLSHAFGSVTEIRNHFTHRPRRLKMSRCAPFEFWFYMRAAVRLALLLGDRDLAFKIDLLVRLHTSSDLPREEAEAQFQADGVEAIVEKLLQPSTRQAVILQWFGGDSSAAEATSETLVLRERWVVIDVLMRGEEEFRGLETPLPDGLPEEEEELSDTEMWELYGEKAKG